MTYYPVCPVCKWMICPDCGMCRKPLYGKCFGAITYDSTEVRYLRGKWCKLKAEQKPLPEDESFDLWCALILGELHKRISDEKEAQKEALEKMQEKRSQKVANIGAKLQNGCFVTNTFGKVGILDSTRTDSKFKIIKIAFEDGTSAEYVFPDAFEKGFLRIKD